MSYNRFERLKDLLKVDRTLFRLNLTGTFCPNCAITKGEYPTAGFKRLYDRVYHKYKFYMRCRYCNTTTPAYEDPNDVIENWNDLFIKKEESLILNGGKNGI